MRRRTIARALVTMLVINLVSGCGGNLQNLKPVPSTDSSESFKAAADDSEYERQESETEKENSLDSAVLQDKENTLNEKISTLMSRYGRPSGDLIKNIEAPVPKEMTEEEGAEMDCAMRAYKPRSDSLLINKATSFYYYDHLDKNQQLIYDSLLMLAEDPVNTDNIVTLPMEKKADDAFYTECIGLAYLALLYDHPELFWLYSKENNSLSVGEYTMGGKDTLYFCFDEPYTNFEKDMKTFNKAAEDFLKDIDLKGSDTEIADAIHDKLIDLATYDYEVCEKNIAADLAHSAYGALVANSRGEKNTCVCDGYSLAYVYLCQQAGLEAAVLTGFAGEDEKSSGGHAWSIVKTGGEWREVDSCWDDFDDLFDELSEECIEEEDEESQKIMMALSDEGFQNALEHYLNCVSTEYITNFNDVESYIFVFDDGTYLALISESVHIRMDKVKDGGIDSVLMKLAPIAK